MFLKNRKKCFFIFCFILGFGIACTRPLPEEKVLLDFESDAVLDDIQWKCYTLFFLSTEHITRGGHSLQMELFPSNYPGFVTEALFSKWQGYNTLALDVFNPEKEDLAITIRIDDRKDLNEYSDRYNQKFVLKAGENRLRIPTASMITSGTERKLNLNHITKFYLFLSHPKEKHVIFMDNIRLVRRKR